MNVIFNVAAKEFKDGIRNRWVVAITVVFAMLAIGISYLGTAASGQVGLTSLPATMVSLASLAVFLIPLIALMLAYDAIVGEDENGTLLLLMTYPLSRTHILLGKFIGHASIMSVSTLLGFGLAGCIIALLSRDIPTVNIFLDFSYFIVSAVLLSWVFIAIAYVISASTAEKSKAAGIALVTWFLFVLVFDLGLLGILVSTEGKISATLFPYLLLLNPTDLFRLVNIIHYTDGEAYSGLMAVAHEVAFSPHVLFLFLFIWIAMPLTAALALFSKRKT